MSKFLARVAFACTLLLFPCFSPPEQILPRRISPQGILAEIRDYLRDTADPVDENDSSAAANVSRANRGEATIRPNGYWYHAKNIHHPYIKELIGLAHAVNEMSYNPALRENALEQADRLCEDIREKLSGSSILFREENGSLDHFLDNLLRQIEEKLIELRRSQLPVNRLEFTAELNELLTRFPILITQTLLSNHPDIPELMELIALVADVFDKNSPRRKQLVQRSIGLNAEELKLLKAQYRAECYPRMEEVERLIRNLVDKNRGTEFGGFFQRIYNKTNEMKKEEDYFKPCDIHTIYEDLGIWTPEPFSRKKAKDWRKFIKSPKIDKLSDCGLFCLFRWMIDVTSLETLVESTRQIEEHLDFLKNKLGDEAFSITFHSTLGMLNDFRGIIDRVNRILNQKNPIEDRVLITKDKDLFAYLINIDEYLIILRDLKSYSFPLLSHMQNLGNDRKINAKESLEETRTRNYNSNQNNNQPPSDLESQFNKHQLQVMLRIPNLLNLHHNEIPGTIIQRVDTSTIGFSGFPGPQILPLEKRKVNHGYKGHYHRQVNKLTSKGLRYLLTHLPIILLGLTSLLGGFYA